jgi:NAD+ kinase
VAAHPQTGRVALVVHPTREIDTPLGMLERWTARQGMDLVQIPAVGRNSREVARQGELESGDIVVALGGDGTVLSALRASAPKEAPVLGVACGSLGALTAVPATGLEPALDRIQSGDWIPRRLPALSIQPADAPDQWAVNDFVVVRRGAGQAVVDVSVDDELYVRLAGDGIVVATALGSSAYSMAAGGPLLVRGTEGIVCTPIAMHGGNAPPIVVPRSSSVRLEVRPSFAGFDVEIDGQTEPDQALDYRISLHDDMVTLVSFGEPDLGLTGLRKRGLITDSPRVLARDLRAAHGG